MAKKLGLIPRWSDSDIKKKLKAVTDRLEEAIVMRFSYIGETFVTNARTKHTYKDITGNLTASIGFSVLKNGKIVGGGKVLDELKGKYPTGFVLLVWAGMDYAAAVESRGKDVLTASSLIAKQDLIKAIESFKEQISGKRHG